MLDQTKHKRSPRHIFLDALLLLTLAAAFLSWLLDPLQVEYGWLTFRVRWDIRPILSVLIVAGLWRLSYRRVVRADTPRLFTRLVMGMTVTLFVLAAIEGAFALAGVPKGQALFVIHGRNGEDYRDDGAEGRMVHDPDVLWRFVPDTVFNGLLINSQGFAGRDFSSRKASGIRRIAVMGDSCSAQGHPAYADLLHNLLNEDSPGPPDWEVINNAVHGYTVLQGQTLYEKRVRAFSPDIVILYFGWNSHWLADQPDHLRMCGQHSGLTRAIVNGLAKKRMTTWARRLIDGDRPGRTLRVAPDRYETALAEWIALIRNDGAEPIVLTAPRAERLSRALAHNGNAESVKEAERLHDLYVEITRSVASAHEARTIDLAAELPEDLRPHFFTRDGIHLTSKGHEWIAGRLALGVRTYEATGHRRKGR